MVTTTLATLPLAKIFAILTVAAISVGAISYYAPDLNFGLSGDVVSEIIQNNLEDASGEKIFEVQSSHPLETISYSEEIFSSLDQEYYGLNEEPSEIEINSEEGGPLPEGVNGRMKIRSDRGDPAFVYVGQSWHLWAETSGSGFTPVCSCWDFNDNGKIEGCYGSEYYVGWPLYITWAERCVYLFPGGKEWNVWWDGNHDWDYHIPMDTSQPAKGYVDAWVGYKTWRQHVEGWFFDYIYYEIKLNPPNVRILDIWVNQTKITSGQKLKISVRTKNYGEKGKVDIGATVSDGLTCDLPWKEGVKYNKNQIKMLDFYYTIPPNAPLGYYDIASASWNDCTGDCPGPCCTGELCSGLQHRRKEYNIFEVVQIACYKDSDCSADGYYGSNYCSPSDGKNSDVYRNWRDYYCYRPGTPQAKCKYKSTPKKQQDCGDTTYDPWGKNYCSGNRVMRNRTVHEKGCRSGSCYSKTIIETQLVKICPPDQNCVNGECVGKDDLYIHSSDIEFSPSSPVEYGTNTYGPKVYIKATVHSNSTRTMTFDLKFYDGDPTFWGRLISKTTGHSVAPKSQKTVQVRWNHRPDGDHKIFVLIDNINPPDGKSENNKASNPVKVCKEKEVVVGGKCTGSTLIFFFAPVNWDRTGGDPDFIEFDIYVDEQADFLIDSYPFKNCRDKVKIQKLHHNCEVNMRPKCPMLTEIENCVRQHSTVYDYIVGMEDDDVLENSSGFSCRQGTIFIEKLPVLITAHEIGHENPMRLKDEYCDCQDRDRSGKCIGPNIDEKGLCGPFVKPNPLKASLGCDVSDPNIYDGRQCSTILTNACCWDHGKYYTTCCGNRFHPESPPDGRCIMSYVDAPYPRGFDPDDYEYLSKISKVNCSNVGGSPVISFQWKVFKDDTVELEELTAFDGTYLYPNGYGDYIIKLFDESGSLLYNEDFEIIFYLMSDPPTPTNNQTVVFRLPYTGNERKVVLLHNGTEIFSKTFNFCNNNHICENLENYYTCSGDCPSGSADGYCDKIIDGICDPDCGGNVDPDCTPPIVTISSPESEKNYSYTVGLVPITYTAVDDEDPSPDITKLLNGEEYIGSSIDMDSLEIGTYIFDDFLVYDHILVIEAKDDKGSVGSAFVVFKVIDDVPPTSSATVNGTFGNNGWYVSDVEVILEGYDEKTGIKKLEYNFDASDIYFNYTSPIQIADEGITNIYFRAVDDAGNVETPRHSLEIKIDKTPPESILYTNWPLYNNGSHLFANVSTVYTINASDNVSGLDKIEVDIDGLGFEDYTGPFQFSSERVYTIEYRAIDIAGNIEETNVFEVNVDDTAPDTSLLYGAPRYLSGSDVFITSSTPLVLFAEEDGLVRAGINYSAYNVDSTGWVIKDKIIIDNLGWVTETYFNLQGFGEGYHSIEFYSMDYVYNKEDVDSGVVIVDDTPPTTIITIGDPKYDNGTHVFVKSETNFTLSAVDGGKIPSGVQYSQYRVDSGTWMNRTIFNLTGFTDGWHVIDYRSIDNVDNTETYSSITIGLDNTPPEIVIYSPEARKYFTIEDITINFSVTDAMSGVKSYEAYLDNASVNNGDVINLAILSIGNHTFMVIAYDNLDNMASESVVFEVAKTEVWLSVTPIAKNKKEDHGFDFMVHVKNDDFDLKELTYADPSTVEFTESYYTTEAILGGGHQINLKVDVGQIEERPYVFNITKIGDVELLSLNQPIREPFFPGKP